MLAVLLRGLRGSARHEAAEQPPRDLIELQRRRLPRCHAAAAAAAAAAGGILCAGLGRGGLRRVRGAAEEERAVLEAAQQPRVESLRGEEREELAADAARVETALTLQGEAGGARGAGGGSAAV